MAERAVVMVLEIPFIQAFSMENVQAFEFADHLRAEDWFKAYHAYKLIFRTIRGERRAVSFGPPLLECS